MKKGFTLIELLAVIVILAIIALIAVPVVTNIINNAKEAAKLRSAELYLETVEVTIMNKNLFEVFEPSTCTINISGNLVCDRETIKVEAKGEMPDGGSITFINNKIDEVTIKFGDLTIIKNEEGKLVIEDDSSGTGTTGLLTISITGNILYITDNTGYTDNHDYYVLIDGQQGPYSSLGSGVTSYDLTNLGLEEGTYAISVQRYSYDGNDSVTSNTLIYYGGSSSTSSGELIISLNGSMLDIDYSSLGLEGGLHSQDGYGSPELCVDANCYSLANSAIYGGYNYVVDITDGINLYKIAGPGTHTVHATVYIYGIEQTIKSNTITYTYDGTYTTEISS